MGGSEEPRNEGHKRVDEKLAAEERDAAALRSRLDRLTADLADDHGAKASAPDAPLAGSFGSAMSLGFRVLTEFVSAVVVGALVGWQLDKWVGTSPLFLLVFLLLGTAAGFWNVYRIAVNKKGLRP